MFLTVISVHVYANHLKNKNKKSITKQKTPKKPQPYLTLPFLPAIKSICNWCIKLWIPVVKHKAMCATMCTRVLTLNDSPGSAPPRSCSKLASGRSSRASSPHTHVPELAPSTPAPTVSLSGKNITKNTHARTDHFNYIKIISIN